MSEASPPTRKALLPLFRGALAFAAAQARYILDVYPGYSPMYTVGGRWNREGERWTHWCEGFFPGILWLLHNHTGDAEWRRQAERYTRPLKPRRFDRSVHDLGFLFVPTYLRWLIINVKDNAAEEELEEVLLDAGRTLALRRQKGGYLSSFLGPGSLFIDIMMNVGLIFWTAGTTEDQPLLQTALDHCRTSARYLVRPDGSTAHEAIFDPQTGRFLYHSTQQGYSAASTWSRGLAWAIYGFVAADRLSGEEEFLAIARKCADYYIHRCPEGLVPPWDFDALADGPCLWDSSAAAIAASGLLDLADRLEQEDETEGEGDRYRTAALIILRTLCSDQFLARGRPGWEGILLHGVYHYHKKLGVDESVAWGDHFFVEALVKAVAGHSDAGR